ncbi:MMPL family transporter [Embleya hyalina]|uniref:Putative membrane protein ActII-3 n=1 Tax=Embleya hyalina TaxID=516124 RepID=A0A401YRZ9_9ACTN|nr:MMPL family transporter [Embleya hyalina]GCD97346.1 putative membrane protein ActII-3 [Embleya hyalina]
MFRTGKSIAPARNHPPGRDPATDRAPGPPTGRRHTWPALLAWLILIAIAIPLASQRAPHSRDNATVELPRGAESTRVAELTDRFPDGDLADGILIYARPGGLGPADLAKVEADRAALAPLARGPIPAAGRSVDGAAITLVVPLDAKARDGRTPADQARKVRDRARAELPAGLTVRLTGPAGNALDAEDAIESTGRTLTLVTVLVVAVLLLFTYRSPILWLLPLVCVAVALLLSRAVGHLLERFAHLTVDDGNTITVTALLFGAGTDYAMLLLARYREELLRHPTPYTAMRVALRRALPSIAASAATVAAALLCLLAADMGFNHTLGPAGAIAIGCGFVVTATLFPALLVVLGRRVFWPLIPRHGAEPTARRSIWPRLGRGVARRPRLVWIGTSLALGVLAVGALGIETGLDDAHTVVGEPDSVAGQELLAAHFPAGRSRPVRIVADSASAEAVTHALRTVPGVGTPGAPLRSTDGTLVEIRAVLDIPPDSAAAADRLSAIKAAVHAVPNAHALVGGPTATGVDKATAQAHDRRTVIPLVIGVVFLILVLLLRALVAPLLLMATVLLSYLAALGVSRHLFSHVLDFPAMDVQVMLVGFLFLVALGADYNIFLIHRIREEARTRTHESAVLSGLTATGGVITGAGAVLAATFAALTVAPQVAFIQIGAMVALGVLIDTFLVRSILVPALALDAGRAFWWPAHRRPKTADPRKDPVA